MAKIIRLGCEVAEIRHQYAGVHASVFGASSFRSAIDAVIGKSSTSHADRSTRLSGLVLELKKVRKEVFDCQLDDRPIRGAQELRRVLLDYIDSLISVIERLASICGHLASGDEEYRNPDSGANSRYNQEKVRYDHAISHLEYLGEKLNRLFSTY